ncbi:hypothetical protein RvY_13996 [Ramazzottius varieornatus]|uniref:TIMELESS-interacting protein n=1 Tax=Ramazzottius varieornatus TaxID=947166 RepID=A0A1D1VPW5_RAMVA|nr:hypothetical protein RvY_13996 [Ramazzottius varieornatus]
MSRAARNATINLEGDDGDYNDWLEDMDGEDDTRRQAGPKGLKQSTQDDAEKAKDAGKSGADASANAAVEKPKRVLGPRAKLDAARLCGPLGLPALIKDFEKVPWKGKGREEEDLLLMMRKMESWAHAMYPKFRFDDIVDKIEQLGRKREVRTCVRKLMEGMPVLPEDFVSHEQDDGRATPVYNLLFQKAAPQPSTSVQDPTDDDILEVSQQPAPSAKTVMEDEAEFEEMLASMEEPDMPTESVETAPTSLPPLAPPRPNQPARTTLPNLPDDFRTDELEQMDEDDILAFINNSID